MYFQRQNQKTIYLKATKSLSLIIVVYPLSKSSEV